MTLETERCTLRSIQRDDQHDLHQLYASKDVRRFLGGAADDKSFKARFEELIGNPDTNWAIHLKDNNEFVGVVSIAPSHEGDDQEISYQVQKKFWSKGLASEAVKAVMIYAAETLKLPGLIAETQDANEPSKNLLKKLGMRFDGTVVRYGEKQAIFRKTFS